MARLFFGLSIPDDVRARALDLTADLRRTGIAASWVPGPNLHVTMKFLGEVPDRLLHELVAEAAARVASVPSFQLTIRGAGAFPSPKRPKVLWAGGRAGGDEPAELARQLDAAGKTISVMPEDKSFRTHITVGRVRSVGGSAQMLEQILAAWQEVVLGQFAVSEVTLFKSEIGQGPPRYTVVGRFPLGSS